MKRTLYLGNTDDGAVFAFITLATKDPAGNPIGPADDPMPPKHGHARLTISYVVGPTAGGNARGGTGTGVANDLTWTKYAPGWDAAKVAALAAIAGRWHLNDVTAGSPAQEEYMRQHPRQFEVTYPTSHYENACKQLGSLNPDRSMDPPYAYGSAWLYEELPAEVVTTLMGLPNGGGRRPPGEWDR